MKPDQPAIYYAVGETRSQAAMSPALEKIKNKGYEVILISEPIDEMALQSIEEFSGKKLVDVGKEMTGTSDLSEVRYGLLSCGMYPSISSILVLYVYMYM
jgi:HSP90 family molecular chaperone